MLPKSCMCCCKHTQLMLNQDILLSWIELSADIFDGLSLNGYRVAIIYIYIYIHDDDDDDDDDVNFLLMHNIMQDLATISTCNWSQT